MSPQVLFVLALIIGIVFLFVAKTLKKVLKFAVIVLGICFALFGSFGVFTSLL